MININMLVDHYIGFLKFICTYLEHVYHLQMTKTNIAKLHVYILQVIKNTKNMYV